MRRTQRSLSETLARSLALSGLAYAAVVLYAVPATLLTADSGPEAASGGAERSAQSQVDEGPTWRPAYAKHFPDCVDMARWVGPDVPETVVVLHRDGGLRRMTFAAAVDRATSDHEVDVWTVGACR